VRINPFGFTLAIHVILGTVALLIAPLAMVTVKGGLWHRRWGKIYFWAMAGVALTATVMCWLRSGIFLFLIATFSFYLALSGYRVLKRKRPEVDKPHILDWTIVIAVILAGSGLIFFGVRDAKEQQQWVPIVFGVIGLLLGLMDIVRFLKPPRDKQAWMFLHMTGFLGAYVATVTAFTVVNFRFLSFYWRWLGPTLVGTLGITIWRTYYARKFKRQNHGILQ
jgi:hypothetical protein